MARREVLNQLQHLECQLSAIENTARTVQSELLVSNKVNITTQKLISATCIYVLADVQYYLLYMCI